MRRIALTLLLASAGRATAQTPCTSDLLSPLPAGDVAWCAASKAPSLVAQAAIRYPDILLSANVEGEVTVEATVDTGGRIDLHTLKVRSESHAIFTSAVRQSLPTWRFVPAQVDGIPVRARGVLRVAFLLPRVDSIPREAETGPPRETPTGLDVALGWRQLPYDPPATVDTMRLYSLIAAISRSHGAVDTIHACIEWQQADGRIEPPAALIDYLRDHGALRLPPSRCPRTYASMIAYVDSLGRPFDPRPPGAVDPQILSISGLRAWTKNVFVFDEAVWVGMRRRVATCQAQWDADANDWQIRCGNVRSIVS